MQSYDGLGTCTSTFGKPMPSLTLKDLRDTVEKLSGVDKEPDWKNYLRYIERKEAMKQVITPKYQVGTRVKVRSFDPMRPQIQNKEGTIVRTLIHPPFSTEHQVFYAIEFDTFINGHDGGGVGIQGHCWVCHENDIQFIGLTAKKGHPMSALSTLAKRAFDEDTKAMVKIGLLDQSLRVSDPGLLLDMLMAIFTKELAAEAKKRIEEAAAEEKEK